MKPPKRSSSIVKYDFSSIKAGGKPMSFPITLWDNIRNAVSQNNRKNNDSLITRKEIIKGEALVNVYRLEK